MSLSVKLPTSSRPRRGAGRPAVHAMRWASCFRDVGLNKTRHAPSRKNYASSRPPSEEGLQQLLIHQLQLLLTVQGWELFIAVSSIALRIIDRPYSSSIHILSEPVLFPLHGQKRPCESWPFYSRVQMLQLKFIAVPNSVTVMKSGPNSSLILGTIPPFLRLLL